MDSLADFIGKFLKRKPKGYETAKRLRKKRGTERRPS